MDGFDVTYAYVDQATQQLVTETQNVANAIETLDSQMQAVRADLEGATAEAYDAKVKQWRLNVADMNVLLGRAQAALNEIRNNYSGTDGREATEWAALL
ncbi:WXG100 family type VII secretion target [Nocardiopsis sp. NPDC049922]|uniref:WXG100 family type VII secretion target n=1 Tax=Nocardiopsis sp. NPDC049922 TaxID=3155157 RepID=UPI0033F8CF88